MRGDTESLEKENRGGLKRGDGLWFHLASFEPHSGFIGDGLEGGDDFTLVFSLHWLCLSQNSVLEQIQREGVKADRKQNCPGPHMETRGNM